MKKKIITGSVSFIVGIVIAFYADSFFRSVIQDLFQWTTNGKIEYQGKSFFILNDISAHIIFAISFPLFTLVHLNSTIQSIEKNIILWLVTFTVSLILTCAIIANYKVFFCANCGNGILKMYHGQINYPMILYICLFLSSLPSIFRITKSFKG